MRRLQNLPDGVEYMLPQDFRGSKVVTGKYIVPKETWLAVYGDGESQEWKEFLNLEDAVEWLEALEVSWRKIAKQRFERILAKYICEDAEKVESSYAISRAHSFGLTDRDLKELGLDWLLELQQRKEES